jgi:LuxR family maltose regulon positive regulatory protein
MQTPLLITKLYAPPPCPTLVLRPRLTKALANALTRRLTLVSAPAGYGKTTLVSTWLRTLIPDPGPKSGPLRSPLGEEGGAGVKAAWLSLDEGDDDPIRFLHYFITALEQIVPTMRVDWLGMLQGMQPAPFEALMSLLINEIAKQAVPSVLVLDDFHVIQAHTILEMLTFLFEHMPSQMHLVLLSRIDPPLPLARLRARNQLVDIRADQLRFTPDEIAVFLNEVMGLALSADDIAAMETRTEGWIAGLQLAALSMQGLTDVHSFVSAFTGSHHYLMDYLTEEVLKFQPEGVRSFLLQTSILGRMCGPLCDAVLGIGNHGLENQESGNQEFGKQNLSSDLAGSHHLIPDSLTPDSQSLLEYLERANLFLIPLDGERRWYRYHHLFADVLNRRLEHLFPQQLPDLHLRASRWFEQNGFIPEATQHALMAGDQDRAARLVEDNGCPLIMRGESITLLKWIDAVESYAQTRPWLAIQKAWALVLTGRSDQVEQVLQAVEQLISRLEPTVEVRTMLGCVAAARAHQANTQGEARLAADYARQALEYLPDSDAFPCSLRSAATSILGDASWMNGDLEEARRAYAEAVRIGQAAGNDPMIIIASTNLADVLMEQGQLHQAARIYSEILHMATRPDGQRPPLVDRVLSGLTRVSYEWNQMEAAAQYAHQCIELCRQWGNSDLQAVSYVMLARLEHVQSHPEQAQTAMQAAQLLVSEDRLSPRRADWVKSTLARLWIAQGNLERAAHLVHQSGIRPDDAVPYLREPEYLTLLRLLLAQGDQDAALALSERLLHRAEAANRLGRIIEILALQALAWQGKKDMPQALAALERALLLAQPEGYVRVFLDEGEPMAKLLYQAKSHRMGTGYAAELLSALGRASGATPPPAQLLIEPLTMRELEVLRLIEAGLSNQGIGDRLVISIPTVKRHISNIYAKLGVKSRTQAVSLARELGLFE